MALSLSSERSVAAASHVNLFAAFARWIGNMQAARTRKASLTALLELDSARLNDLGVSRDDVLAAMSQRAVTLGQGLNAARARNARR